jgi:hypothetical protein
MNPHFYVHLICNTRSIVDKQSLQQMVLEQLDVVQERSLTPSYHVQKLTQNRS